MANPSKAKGTNAESAVVKWLHANGFTCSTRQPLSGNRDKGDISISPGVIAEIKAHKLATGYPTRAQLNDWMRQTQTEATNARADVSVLIVKRKGTQDVGRWFAHIDTRTFLSLMDVDHGFEPPDRIAKSLVMLPVADLALLLRYGGHGTPIEDEEAT